MVAREARGSAIIGIPLGLVAAFVGWWAVAVSVALSASGMILVHALMDWWSIGPTDLEESIRSTALRPGTIELAGAWTVLAAAHLLAVRRASGSRLFPHPSPAD